MDVIYRCCAGIDVHKSQVAVNLLRRGVENRPDIDEVRSFSTMIRALMTLADWLQKEGCTHVAVSKARGCTGNRFTTSLSKSSPSFWSMPATSKPFPAERPMWPIAAWIAQLLQHGLLKASFIPPAPIRDLRDLTRERLKLIQGRAAVTNRIAKVLEDSEHQAFRGRFEHRWGLRVGNVACD